MTVLEILNQATREFRDHGVENPRLDAELLLAHAMKLDREGLYLRRAEKLSGTERGIFERLARRRLSGEPLQYLLGRQEFWSIEFKVDSRVLIPRPETELLVEQAMSILSLSPRERRVRILEIGTGSGAVAVSLAREGVGTFLVATDISSDALELARENAKAAGVLERIAFVAGDLFTPFRPPKGGRGFDLILSNPPYIARSEILGLAREVKDHEPRIALDGGESGLEISRSILSQASLYLERGGWLLLELGQGQGPTLSQWIEEEDSFSIPELVRDLSGAERMIMAQRR